MAAHQARKRFGQHFLSDLAVVDEIVRSISPERSDLMVEIGPGLSALTRPLLDRLDHLHAVEIDRDLAQRLRRQYPAERLTVHEADALTVDFSTFGTGVRIVGNLPYNISSPLLFHLMAVADQVRDQHFMLQREVIDRMVAKPGSADYGRLSVMLQSRYRMINLFDVPPEAFDPAAACDVGDCAHASLAGGPPAPAQRSRVFHGCGACVFTAPQDAAPCAGRLGRGYPLGSAGHCPYRPCRDCDGGAAHRHGRRLAGRRPGSGYRQRR